MARREAYAAAIIPFPRPKGAAGERIVQDIRFRSLLGAEKWDRLPAPIRARFGRCLPAGCTVTYVGEIVETRMSWAGWLLAQLLRPIGAPLPVNRAAWVPATVAVTADAQGSGQYWTRIYGRRRHFPQVIQSSKRFAGPTGLEENLGHGIGIALKADADETSIWFVSDHLFLTVLGKRIALPHWLTPGTLTISHIDCGHGDFAFVLKLDHRWLGELIGQIAIFSERPNPTERGAR